MFPTNNEFESEFTFEKPGTPSPDEPPFHVLLLGDWSGGTTEIELNSRKPISVDRDNFEEVLKKLNVRLELEWQGVDEDLLSLQFNEIDDFHPDNLFRQVSLFSDLRDVRRRLSNPDTFEKAASDVRSWFQPDETSKNESEIESDSVEQPPLNSENLLDLILTGTPQPVTTKTQVVDNSELGRFVSKIVSPHLIRVDEKEQSKLTAAVDQTISELMRAILHHPKFQALESAWRGLYFLVRGVETDSDLKIYIFDVSKTELLEDLKSVNNLSDSFFYRQLISDSVQAHDNKFFTIVGGNYNFDLNVDDVASLLRIGKISAAAQTPFLSYIRPDAFGIDKSFEDGGKSQLKFPENSTAGKLWAALRDSPDAQFIGLSPMRVLARMPYGNSFDPIEHFAFEEFTVESENHQLLWMNPCFAGVFLLAKSFSLFRWQMERHLQQDIENLPLFIYQTDGVTKTAPCAEILLTESLLEQILELGLIPIVSFRDSDKVKLWRFQSISSINKKLGGRWNL